MEGVGYVIVIWVIGALFFTSAVFALFWASRHGHLRNFDENAKTIFDAEEPEGMEADHFPGKNPPDKH